MSSWLASTGTRKTLYGLSMVFVADVLSLPDAFGGVIGVLYDVIFCFNVRCLYMAADLVRFLPFVEPWLQGRFYLVLPHNDRQLQCADVEGLQ